MIVICNVQINKQDIITRKIDKSKDIPLIKEISVKCFPDEDAFEIVNALFDIEHFYVAEFVKEKKVVGYIAFGIYSIRTSHIMILAVHPDYQQNGIGSILLSMVTDIAEKLPITKIRLEVRTTNIPAIKFYEKYNFDIITKLESYYDDASNAYLMTRDTRKETKEKD